MEKRRSVGKAGAPVKMLTKLGIVLTDRGSKYAVSGAPVRDRDAVGVMLKDLKRDKSYAKATHNTWGVLLSDGGPIKGDDGEAGAGMVILRMLERAGLMDHMIVVTRWYGGKHLGGDRFRHVQTCVSAYLEAEGDGGKKAR